MGRGLSHPWVKLSSALGKADTIILNGAECEPYITADHAHAGTGEKVIGGARFRACPRDGQATIGVEGNKLRREHLMILLPTGESAYCGNLRTRYPRARKQLIQVSRAASSARRTARRLGCCVFNVGTQPPSMTAFCVPLNPPHCHGNRPRRSTPDNLMVPGHIFAHLIEEAAAFACDPARVISAVT
jgi:electron transport complex protein RnfC